MSDNPTPTVSVIVVTYNSAAHLRETLDALCAQDYPHYEAIVVENASSDDSLAIARSYGAKLRVVANDTNRGFSGGNHDGVAISNGEYLFILNPDAILPRRGLHEAMRAFRERPNAGVVGGKLVLPDGKTIHHCGGWMGLPAHGGLYGNGELDEGQRNEPASVDWVMGAALVTPRVLWDRLGGFDQDYYPAYYEDADYCLRCRRLGRDVLYWPPLRIVHYGNVSQEYMSDAYWEALQTSRIRYTLKNHGLPALLFKALPRELKWYFTKDMRYLRPAMRRVYRQALKRVLKTGRLDS